MLKPVELVIIPGREPKYQVINDQPGGTMSSYHFSILHSNTQVPTR